MGKTRTELRLEQALEALKYIGNDPGPTSSKCVYAKKIHTDLTTPRTEQVEVKRWVHVYPDGNTGGFLYTSKQDAEKDMVNASECLEITIPVSRPVKEESCCRRVTDDGDGGAIYLSREWIGKLVKVELIEEGE